MWRKRYDAVITVEDGALEGDLAKLWNIIFAK